MNEMGFMRAFNSIETYVVIVVFVATSVHSSIQLKCPESGCLDLNVYLGPKWGSKIIRFPENTELEEPSEEGTNTKNPNTKELQKDDQTSIVNVSSYHRPVPDDNSLSIDYSDALLQRQTLFGEENHAANSTLNMNVNEMINDGTLNLTNMGIKGDEVKSILESIDDMKVGSIERLYLSHNPFGILYGEELSSQFSRLTSLKVLDLSATSLRGASTLDLPTLEVLNLSNNHLVNLPAIIMEIPKLQELDLSSNRFSALVNSFTGLDNLRILSLTDNDMYIMNEDVFTSLKLEKLYLNNNRFHMLYQIFVDPITSPDVKLYLEGNPLECNCYLQEDLLNRNWPTVADWDQLRCKNFQMISDYARDCHSLMGRLSVLPDYMEAWWLKLRSGLRKLGVPSPDWFIMFSGTLLLLWLVYWLQTRTAKINKTSTNKVTVPYVVLDSKQIP